MSPIDIIRAWKDEEYRATLSEGELAQLPENPAGLIELTDIDHLELADNQIAGVAGGEDLKVRPTPPIAVSMWKCYGSFYKCGGGGGSAYDACPSVLITACGGGGSAVDACPSALGCTYVGCSPQTADSCGIVACL